MHDTTSYTMQKEKATFLHLWVLSKVNMEYSGCLLIAVLEEQMWRMQKITYTASSSLFLHLTSKTFKGKTNDKETSSTMVGPNIRVPHNVSKMLFCLSLFQVKLNWLLLKSIHETTTWCSHIIEFTDDTYRM